MQIQQTAAILSAHPLLAGLETLDYGSGWWAGPNDGGIKRGDREETGDNAARPDELGHGPAEATVDSTSLGGGDASEAVPPANTFDAEQESADSDLEIVEANDGRIGLTGLPGSPAIDWAADTGETRNPNE